MIKIYGTLPSRMFRCLWMLEETGVPYEVVRTGFDALRRPEYLEVNPNARMPSLRDGELVMWESMAINLYLAEKYGRSLWPSRIEDRATLLKWTFWAVNEIEEPVVTMLTHRAVKPVAERVEPVAAAAEERLQAPLAVLDKALAGRAFVLGNTFSAADVNVAGILSSVLIARASLVRYPNVGRWLKTSLLRPFPATFFKALL